jgi:hypothetical protein
MARGMTAPGGSLSTLPPRDRAVVELVARFRQLSARHVQEALFAGLASKTPGDRTLKRLCERGYLVRLARPVGGDGGGSNQHVYQLGRVGWRMLGMPGSYWVARSVNRHSLAIADCFVSLTAVERGGQLTVLRFDTEPDCHRAVGTVRLTPDSYFEVGLWEHRLKFMVFLEVDLGSEHPRVIREKCTRYWQAYQQWPNESFPYVVYVVPDTQRRQELERVVAAVPDAAQALFRVCELPDFPELIHRNLQ